MKFPEAKVLVLLLALCAAARAEDTGEDERFEYFDLLDEAQRLLATPPRSEVPVYATREMQALERLVSQGFLVQQDKVPEGRAAEEGGLLGGDGGSTLRSELKKPPKLTAPCNESYHLYLAARDSMQYWALLMLDAGGKPESGFLLGETHWMGSYSECINATSGPTGPPFKAKYCTVNLSGGLLPLKVRLATCQPDTCTNADVKKIIQARFTEANITGMKVGASCLVFDKELDEPAIGVLSALGVFALLLIVGTTYDVLAVQRPKWRLEEQEQEEAAIATRETRVDDKKIYLDDRTPLLGARNDSKPQEPGVLGQILVSFSVYTNSTKLFSTAQGEGALTAVNGIRFLSMTWVVLGHTFSSGMKVFRNKGAFMMEERDRWTFLAIMNATVSVDSFFFLSGLLVAYLTFKELFRVKSLKKFNWGMFYFHRFWRLTPPYMFVMMVFVPLFSYLNDGPLWSTRGIGGNCDEKWWTNLLYINNLVEKVSCMGWSWYLANDMQFYILSPLIMIPFFIHAGLGCLVALAFLLATTITPGVLSYDADWGPSNLGGGTGNSSYMKDYYIKPWNRMGPYIVGLVLGYVLQRTKCRVKIPKLLVLLGWCVAAAINLAVLYGPYEVLQDNFMSRELAAFYNATNRTAWSLGLAWVVFACATGYGGIVNMLMSWSALVPLSRLTYCCYLVHPVIQSLYYNSREQYIRLTDINVVYLFFGHLIATYMVAYVTSLTFEAPMMGLEKAILRRGKK